MKLSCAAPTMVSRSSHSSSQWLRAIHAFDQSPVHLLVNLSGPRSLSPEITQRYAGVPLLLPRRERSDGEFSTPQHRAKH